MRSAGPLSPARVVGLLALAVSAPLGAQDAGVRRDAGRRALEAGRRDEACGHLVGALEIEPTSAETLELLLEANEDDPEALALWTLAWYEAMADGGGRARPGASTRGLLADGPWEKLVAARASAVEELLELATSRDASAKKRVDEALVADWARRVAVDVARPLAAFADRRAELLGRELTLGARPYDDPVDGLESLIRAVANSDPSLTARAARALHGLAVQAGFEDLRGDVPRGMGRLRATAGQALGRARSALAARSDPWTVEQLEWLTGEEGEAFTREHDSFGEPGVALSPEERYRVETDCGFETLLGTAKTVELHHRRLVNFFGDDPFLDVQGTVRVVPTAAGLEAEGSPFWWAAGFQGGDTTVVRHAMGNIEGLGRLLTHELTHRFDGAIYPGQPAWLVEGKAVWTGAAYGHSTDEEFVPNHAAFGTLASVGGQGWGSPGKLMSLIEGTLEDYRENYSAGYALYVYLNTWADEDENPVFQRRLQAFMESAREGTRDPKRFFVSMFCDGSSGRPEKFSDFAAGFAEFLGAFRSEDPPEWISRYTQAVPRGPSDSTTMDEPTWPWSHARHEPPFGRDQARIAAGILLEGGRDKEAAAAGLWSLGVDGREPRTLRTLHAALVNTRRKDAAWVAAHALAFPHGPTEARPGEEFGAAPFTRDLRDTRALLAALAEASSEQGELGHEQASALLAADHDRLARWLGEPTLEVRLERAAGARHPLVRAPRALGDGDEAWVEAELIGHEPESLPGPWGIDAQGDLHLGRRDPGNRTGLESSGGGAVFVRDAEGELPGSYVVHARIQPTTVRAAGAIVLAHFDRDRAVRFGFTLDASRGSAEPSLEGVSWSLAGTWERDGALEGSAPSGGVDFLRSVTGFTVDLVVDGPSVRAYINGRYVGAYATADGAPIEGYVGFATSYGAVEVREPRVQRLDRARLAGLHGAAAEGAPWVSEPGALDTSRARTPSFDRLENLRVLAVPRASQGALLLWIPMPWPEEGREVDPDEEERRALAVAERLAAAHGRADATQPVMVALPSALGEDVCLRFEESISELFDERPTFIRHAFDGARPPGLGDAPDLNKRWLLLLDPSGTARIVVPAAILGPRFSGRIDRWLRVLRDHGRPDRVLPEVERTLPEDER